METNSEIHEFIRSYTSASREQISFQWNEKHGAEFVDKNLQFRGEIVEAVVNGIPTSPRLLADLFEEETSFAVEAWGAPENLTDLARLLLIEGGPEHVLAFIKGKWKSFDTEMACADMRIPESDLRALQAYCASQAEAGGADSDAYAVGARYFSELLS
jgi:hypothetical protein